MLATLALVLLVTHGPPCPSATQESATTPIPGTRVELRVPTGFQLVEPARGIVEEETGTSVLVMEMPTSYSTIIEAMTPERLAKDGLKLLDAVDVRISGRAAKLLRIEQTMQGLVVAKRIGLLGNEREVVMLIGSCAKALPERIALIEEVVLSARWDSELAKDPFEGLPYRITHGPSGDSPGLVLASELSKTLAFTVDGRLPQEDPGDPLLVVGPSLRKAPQAELREQAEVRLKQTALVERIEIESSKPQEIGGVAAWIVVARARHAETKESLLLYQVMLEGDEGYLLLQGRVRLAERERWLPAFERMGASLRWRKPPGAEGERR